MENEKTTFRDCMFDAGENPGINFFKNKALWLYLNVPDFSALTGFKLLALRIFGFAFAISLLGWLITEGVTIEGIIIRSLLLTLFFAIVYANSISGMVYSILSKWESFK